MNYLSYYFLIDILSSIGGVITFERPITYFRWRNVLYYLKFLRFFTFWRLKEQFGFLKERIRDKFGRLFPRLISLLSLIQVLFVFYLFIHFLATILIYRAVKVMNSGESWFFLDKATAVEYII